MSMLDYLKNKRVFSATVSDTKKTIIIAEECDEYFSVALSKHEMNELLIELTDLCNQMET